MNFSKCAVFHCKKIEFIKEQKASEWLSSLGIKAPLTKIAWAVPLLF